MSGGFRKILVDIHRLFLPKIHGNPQLSKPSGNGLQSRFGDAIFVPMEEKMTTEKLNSLPKDVLVFMYQQLLESFEVLKTQNNELMQKLTNIEETLAVNNGKLYGRKTEKSESIPGQMAIDFEHFCIVNESELLVEKLGAKEPTAEEVIVKRPKHYKSKKENLSNVPREIVPAIELTENELKELFPNGYKRMPDETYTEVEMHPATFLAKEYHIAVYASVPDKHGNVEFARGPRRGRLFGSDSIATSTLVSGIINGKYGNANPLNRLSNAFLASDINLSPQDMAGWCIKAANRYFQPLHDLMHQQMIDESRLIHADESFFKVTEDLKARGKNAKSYMWLYHSDSRYGCHPMFLYEYCPTRSSENPERFLKGYSGILLTDGYQAYHKLANENPDKLTVAGCWAHCLRRYSNLIKAVSTQRAKGTVAKEAHDRIDAIYHVDNMYKELPPEERKKMRQKNVKPLVDAFFEYLKNVSPAIDKSSETGKAVAYSLNQEQYLREFLNNGIIPLDNNDAERSIRSFCVNRANWHIINSKGGARASGILLSMTETAKANGLKVFDYLTYVLDQMKDYAYEHKQKPTDMSFDKNFLENLLPWSEKIPDECKLKIKR